MQTLFFLIVVFLSQNLMAAPSLPFSLDQFNKEKSFLIENEKNTIEVFKEASPMVVTVDSTRLSHNFFSMSSQEVPAGSGTGFLWDDQGHVVTNFHVIQSTLNSHARPSEIWVTLKDGKRRKASVVGFEAKKDIAILKLEGKAPNNKGFSNKIADSKKLQVGQKVLAIGSPFGFDQTLTTGIVSALNRSMPSVFSNVSIRNMIQTDASINPGN